MEAVVLLLKIMLINLVLSGDNALVIAMASRNLPEYQRKYAIWIGTVAAIGIRVVLTAVAMLILVVPYIQAVGAILLLYIAFKLLMENEDDSHIRQASTLSSAVWTIMVADFVMSLDNVIAVAAVANGHLLMLILGVAFSIPLIIWGSTLVLTLLHRFPFLNYAGAGVLGYTSGEMLLGDRKLASWFAHMHDSIEWVLPLACLLAVVIGGWIGRRISE